MADRRSGEMAGSRIDRERRVDRAAECWGRRERVERLGSALARMAGDLVAARRKIAVLERENAVLRARLADRDAGKVGGIRSAEVGSGGQRGGGRG